uniref:Uncharacterized protein n=1 Tax=Panagrolaimus sp. PS1159 TaxID=55785 RepID=A0AC35G2V4_9BILA
MCDLEEALNKTESKKGPDVVIYDEYPNEAMIKKISENCQFFAFDYESSDIGALLKARLLAGDPDLEHIQVFNIKEP